MQKRIIQAPRGYCGLCHRPLKDPKSIRRGYGPVCFKKIGGEEGIEEMETLAPVQLIPLSDQDLPEVPVNNLVFYSGEIVNKSVSVRIRHKEKTGSVELQHFPRHSPTGFAWGYNGSGPADLALAILTNAVGGRLADRFYIRFRNQVVSHFPVGESWILTRYAVIAWVHDQVKHELAKQDD